MRSYRGKLPRVGPRTVLDLGRTRMKIDRSAKKVPIEAPWTAARAREWDTTNFGAWLDANVRTRDGRALLHAAFTAIWAEDPHGLNLLGALSRVHEMGGFENLTETRGGLLQDRVVGGPGRVARALAADVDVVLGCPVDAIIDHGSSVELEAGSARITARRAIVAVPPVLARRIRFEPGLPDTRRRALDNLPPGSVIKVNVVYDRPFWRERDLSGRALTVEGPLNSTVDNSPPDGSVGVLAGFVPGSSARELAKRPAAERREAVLGFARTPLRARGGASGALLREGLERGPVVPRLLPGPAGTRRHHRALPDVRRAGGLHPLGGYRDHVRVVRRHERRADLGRAGRGRGARRPVDRSRALRRALISRGRPWAAAVAAARRRAGWRARTRWRPRRAT